MTGPWLGWWPTGLNWKSKAIERVPPVSIKFKGTVIHGITAGFFFQINDVDFARPASFFVLKLVS